MLLLDFGLLLDLVASFIIHLAFLFFYPLVSSFSIALQVRWCCNPSGSRPNFFGRQRLTFDREGKCDGAGRGEIMWRI